jgi:hypothetical protein
LKAQNVVTMHWQMEIPCVDVTQDSRNEPNDMVVGPVWPNLYDFKFAAADGLPLAFRALRVACPWLRLL